MAIFHAHVCNLKRSEKRKSGARPSAAAAFDYIMRRGEYTSKKLAKHRKKKEKEERLIAYASGNMPSWARGKKGARKFWEAADKYERANARLAVKIEFALPRELTLKQNVELVKKIAAELFKNHPWSAAIHGAIAADGKPNFHVHFLVSERALDEIERDETLFFKRANPKFPARGGAAKDRTWNSKHFFQIVRETVARCTNEVLAEHGYIARVDHRSYADRDTQKIPGTHDGPSRRAMKARGVKLKPRPTELEAAKLQNEIANLNREIAAKQRQKENHAMVKSKILNASNHRKSQEDLADEESYYDTMKKIRTQTPAAAIEAAGIETMGLPTAEDYQRAVEMHLQNFGYRVLWIVERPNAPRPRLPAFRATHCDDPQRQIWSNGNGRFEASSEDDNSLLAMTLCAKAAGYKAVRLSGSPQAIATMEKFCAQHGIKVVKDSLPGVVGMDPPPAPPPLVAAPKKPRSKKEADMIRRGILRDSWRTAAAVLPDVFVQKQDGRKVPVKGHDIFELLRNCARAAGRDDNQIILATPDRHLKTESSKIMSGMDQFLFLAVTEHGLELDRLRAKNGLYSRDFKDGGVIKIRPALARAIENYYKQSEESVPEKLRAEIELQEQQERERQQQRSQQQHDEQQRDQEQQLDQLQNGEPD